MTRLEYQARLVHIESIRVLVAARLLRISLDPRWRA